MYNLPKYFKNVFSAKDFMDALDKGIDYVEENMIDCEGAYCICKVDGDSENRYLNFLNLIPDVPKEEIKEAMECEESYVLEDLVQDYMSKLNDDLLTLCQEEGYVMARYNLNVTYDDEDGSICVIVYYEDFEELDFLDQEEYTKRKAIAYYYDCDVTEIIDLDEDGTYQVQGLEYKILDAKDEDSEEEPDEIDVKGETYYGYKQE